MFSQTEHRGIPGGLRTQLLVGLLVLVVGTMALVALIGVQLAKRQIRQSEVERSVSAARQLAALRRVAGTEGTDPADVAAAFRASADVDYARLVIDETSWEVGDKTLVDDEALAAIDLADRPTGHRIVERNGSPFVLASATGSAEGTRWRADVLRPLDAAYERIARSRTLLLAYLSIDALFILIVGYAFLTYVVVRPVRAIGTATERAARGDLASHVELLPRNEFGRVGRSFNDMLDELRENRQELRERLDELDAAYRELEQTQDSLIRSEKMASVGHLAAGVAHEIGNPLSAMTGYLDLLVDSELDEEQTSDILERMQKQIERIRTIIRDLLDYSRDDVDEPVGPTNLAACVEEACDLLSPQPRARHVDVAVDIPDGLPKVMANSAQLSQVLVNLLINAADAIKHDSVEAAGTIEIAAERRDDQGGETVEVRITDDGPGIPEEELQRIFDPFYTTKDPGEGTGLGLAIALRIMDRFGGDIDVESTPGDGTTFRLTLQVA